MYYILLFGLYCVNALYLTNYQNNLLFNLLRNKELPNDKKETLNKILYKSREKWAIKQAVLFKQKNPYKCGRIRQDELNLYAKNGLYKSILNYNGCSYFNFYSNIYIQSELKKALSDSFSLSILPKKIRVASKANMTQLEREAYKTLLFTETRRDTSFWHKIDNVNFETINDLDIYRELWNKIGKINDTFTKRIIYLKYDYEFNEIRSNKHVSELMCCSSEYVRKKIKDFKNITYLCPSKF